MMNVGGPGRNGDRRSPTPRNLTRELFLQEIVDKGGVGFALGGAHDLADKKAVELVTTSAIFDDFGGLTRENRIDSARYRARIGHLPQALLLDDYARVGAGRDHFRENILGEPARDRAVGDQVDQRPELHWRHR